jgi:hypothetical protein
MYCNTLAGVALLHVFLDLGVYIMLVIFVFNHFFHSINALVAALRVIMI